MKKILKQTLMIVAIFLTKALYALPFKKVQKQASAPNVVKLNLEDMSAASQWEVK